MHLHDLVSEGISQEAWVGFCLETPKHVPRFFDYVGLVRPWTVCFKRKFSAHMKPCAATTGRPLLGNQDAFPNGLVAIVAAT